MWAAAVLSILAVSPVSLDEVRALSRQNTHALLAELETRRAAEQNRVSAGAVLPHLSLVGNLAYGVGTQPAGFTAADVTLGLSQLLFDGGRAWRQMSLSGLQEEAARAQSEEQRLVSEEEGVRRFYELLRAQKALAVLQETAQRSDEQVDRARALFDAGRATRADVIAAEINRNNDQMEVVRQRARMVAAQSELAAWLMRSGTEEVSAKEPSLLRDAPTKAPAFEDSVLEAKHRRPLLVALNRYARAAELGVSVAHGSHWPRLNAFAAYTRGGLAPSFSELGRSQLVSGGLSLQWELFSGFSTQANVRIAEHSFSSATLILRQAERDVEAAVRSALKGLEAQLEVSALSNRNRDAAREGVILADERFRAGAGSTLEVRDAQLKLTHAELSFWGSRIDVEIARSHLRRATGGT